MDKELDRAKAYKAALLDPLADIVLKELGYKVEDLDKKADG